MGEKVEWRHIIMYILIIYVEYPAVMLPLDNGSKFIDPLSNGSMCFQIKRENVCTFLTGRENGNMCKVFFGSGKKGKGTNGEKSVYYSCSLFPVCFTLLLWEEVYRISLFFSNLLLCGELE